MGIGVFVIHQQQVTALQATKACLWTIDPSPVLILALPSQAVVTHQATTAGWGWLFSGRDDGCFIPNRKRWCLVEYSPVLCALGPGCPSFSSAVLAIPCLPKLQPSSSFPFLPLLAPSCNRLLCCLLHWHHGHTAGAEWLCLSLL